MRKKSDNRMNRETVYFGGLSGRYAFLDMCYPSEFICPEDNITYKSVEQYVQAKKALLFLREDERNEIIYHRIICEKSSLRVKELGRDVRSFNKDVWNISRYEILKEGILQKFKQNDFLKFQLCVELKDMFLIYVNHCDKVNGTGLTMKRIENGEEWKGCNLLGRVLMEVRKML